MRLNLTNDEPFSVASSSRWRATVPLSLFALGAGYVLLVAAPLVSSRFPSLRTDLPSMGSTLPGPVAAGVALLGAAALVLVLAQLVRDVETRPYISIAPVLAVFSGFLLASLRVKLPLEGLASEHAGMFALALALIGGALIAREPLSARFLGWALVLSAPGLLVYVVALPKGQGDLVAALGQLDPQLRMFLGLLCLSSMALGFVGAVARALARVGGRGEFGLDSSSPDLSVRLPRGTIPGWQQPASHMTPQGLTYGNLYQSGYGQMGDGDLAGMRGGSLGRLALVTAIVASAGFAVVYWWTHRTSFESTSITTSSQPATSPTAQPAPVTTPVADAPAPTVSPLNGASKPAAAPSAAAAAREANADTRGSAREANAATREQNVAARAPAREPNADRAAAKEARREAREARKEAREARKEAQAAAKAKAQSERAAREAAKPKQAEAEAEAKPQETAAGRASAAVAGLGKNTSDKKDASDKKADAVEARGSAREQQNDAPASKSPAAKPAASADSAEEATAAKPAAKPASNDDDLDSLLDKAVSGASKVKPRTTTTPTQQANKPAAPTQNERDLDLDNLLKKSVKGSKGGVEAADDPILGL